MKMRICIIAAVLAGMLVIPAFSQTRPDALQSYRAGRDLEGQGRMDEANLRYDEAIRICMNELSQDNRNMDSYTVLTWALQRRQRYRDVVEWGNRGLALNSNDYRIVETMGEAYFYLGDYRRSLEFMQRYVNSLPQGDRASVAYFFIGETYRLQGRFHHADIAYTTAVRLEPYAALWWYRLGMVRESLGDYRPSMEAYEQAVRLNPSYREASAGIERVRPLVN